MLYSLEGVADLLPSLALADLMVLRCRSCTCYAYTLSVVSHQPVPAPVLHVPPLQVKDGTTLVAQDGTEAEVDAVIFTTGFNTEASTKRVDIRGRRGLTLQEAWSAENGGPSAYFGMAVAGFPNMFPLMVGPNIGLVNTARLCMRTTVSHTEALLADVILKGLSRDATVGVQPRS